MLENNSKTKFKRVLILLALLSIILNLSLSFTKWYLGFIFQVLALRAEALNNLADAVSQLLIIFCLYISKKPADKEHPYGHARLEYLSSIGLAIFLALISGQILMQSYHNLTNIKQEIIYNFLNIFVLIISIIFKGLFIIVYYYYSVKINSPSLKASVFDAGFDIMSSLFIIISLIIFKYTRYNLDSYLSVILALFMLYTAYSLLKEMIDALLGQNLSEEERKEILDYILKQEGILGCHDLMAHRYGPTKLYLTCHIDVDANLSFEKAHELSDNIEQYFWHKKGLPILTHLDPKFALTTEEKKIKTAITDYWISSIENCFIHDFRFKNNEKLIYFEVMIPYNIKIEETKWRTNFESWFKQFYPQKKLDYLIEHGSSASYIAQTKKKAR